MERKLVSVRLRGEIYMPVNGWVSATPGLVITPCVTTHRVLETYCVTHESSGWRICAHEFSSVQVAEMFAHNVRDFTDWSVSDEILKLELSSEGSKVRTDRLNVLAQEIQDNVEKDPKHYLFEGGNDVRV